MGLVDKVVDKATGGYKKSRSFFHDQTIGRVGDMWGDLTGKNKEIDVANRNLSLSKRKFEYDKQLQQQIFAREDTAQQRAVKDLTAAGLSPVLAAGAGASSGPVVSTQAPRQEPIQGPDISEAAQLMMNLMSMKANIAQTFAQQKLIDQQREKSHQETRITKHDADIIERTSLTSNPSLLGKVARDIATPIMGVMDRVKEWFNKTGHQFKK